ncbi:MAG: glycoside hydrolase family 127 protein [Planctomycetes bacterium]|nr:glycoside hydrolase family 127 protein [Planctomycetota bacterium]
MTHALVAVLAAGLVVGMAATWAAAAPAPEVVAIKARPFSLKDVRLLDGPFKKAMDLDREYLLSLDPDRLLHTFRLQAGLPSTAKPLGGWEEPKGELRGHSLGHYLTACALMYESTGDERLKARGDAIVAELAKCQDKMGTGYLSAYPEEFIDRVEAGKPVWAPWYTLHKIYAGLLDMHVRCGNAQALEVLRKVADWIQSRTDKLSDDQMERMLGNEHGGVNDVLTGLYAVTGDPKHLKLAQRFNHRAVLDPLGRREDRLTGLHANTQFPKVIGVARQYELTGDERLRTMATFFWDVVTKERSYVIGGNSDGEMFSPKEELSKHIGPNTTETCNTYNMLKLTRRLFGWDPRVEYADYYERALYNHILASQNPETGMMCYYVPLKTGSRKVYNSPNDSFWCCTGTGIENHAKYGDSIYFHDGEAALYVNLFIASELTWKSAGLRLRQETGFPDEPATRLVLACDKPVELAVHVRRPYWAGAGFEVAVNGAKQAVEAAPGSWVVLKRTWQNGDAVAVTMPMVLRTEAFRDNPRKLALMAGPLVLCAEVDPGAALPALLTEPDHVLDTVKPVAGRPLVFTASAEVFRLTGADGGGLVAFSPFFRQHEKPYIVYWDLFNAEQWKALEAEHKAELERAKALEARTVDRVDIGGEQSERDHNLQGENTQAGDFHNRKWRHAPSGWFAYDLRIVPDEPLELLCTYWGSEVGPREFDVLVDGQKIATQRLNRNQPDRFFDEVYAIPADLLRGKQKVTVRFQAHPGNTAGGIFGLRVLKKG